jgi:hypothetical protein
VGRAGLCLRGITGTDMKTCSCTLNSCLRLPDMGEQSRDSSSVNPVTLALLRRCWPCGHKERCPSHLGRGLAEFGGKFNE